jgi:hypothetical protein
VAFGFGDGFLKPLPQVGKEPRRAAAIEPVQFGPHPQEHPAQHQPRDMVRMRLRIGQGQRGPPAAPEQQPAVDAKPGADQGDVVDQMRGGVGLHRRGGPRPPAAALVEQHDAEMLGVEKAAHVGAAAAAGAAMQHQDGPPLGVAAFLGIQDVAVAHVDLVAGKGFDRRVKAAM